MNQLISGFLFFSVFFFFSCSSKDEIENLLDREGIQFNNSIQTIVASEEASEDVMKLIDFETDLYSLIENKRLSRKETSDYIALSKEWNRYEKDLLPSLFVKAGDSAGFPLVIKLYYGSKDYSTVTILNNKSILKGSIQIELDKNLFTKASVRKITYDLIVDGIVVKGSKEIEFSEEQGIGKKFTYTSKLTFGFPDGTELSREAERSRTWISGFDTEQDLSDDRIEIRGTATCVDSENNKYTKRIDPDNPLVHTGTCGSIVSGVLSFSQNEKKFASLTYGKGECDGIMHYTYINEEDEIVTEKIEIGEHNRNKIEE